MNELRNFIYMSLIIPMYFGGPLKQAQIAAFGGKIFLWVSPQIIHRTANFIFKIVGGRRCKIMLSLSSNS